MDGMKAPFTLYFEGTGSALTGSFVNGDVRITSTSASFEENKLRLHFQPSKTTLEASLTDGGLKGKHGDARAMNSFTASKYCTCSDEGEAGPEIMGNWEVADVRWRLTIRRKGSDTMATVVRSDAGLGPLTGRFNGAFFSLSYFDGVQAATLEIEPRRDHGLDLVWRVPGEDAKKYTAFRSK